MTTDMFLAIFLVGPLTWLCLRGEIRTWLDTRRQAERDRNARIVRELRHHQQNESHPYRTGSLR